MGEDVEVDQQRLIFAGQQLEDERPLHACLLVREKTSEKVKQAQSKLSAAAQTRKASQVEEMQQSLMALRDKADKKTMLEQILQQQENVKVENVKLCDVLSAATGVNLHKQVWAGMQKESTLHLVLRLRGGMHDQSS